MHVKKLCCYILLLALVCGCSTEEKTSYEGKLFSKIPASKSNIDFINPITQTGKYNVLTYNYMLNGGGVSAGDFNNDGLVDLFFTGNQVADKLYLNKGDLEFEDISEKAGISGMKDGKATWSTGATVCDVNMDGFLDIYVCKSGPTNDEDAKRNMLFVNNGDLTFTESAKKYGVDDTGWSTQATFFDYDRDGDLDLYTMNHSFLFDFSISKARDYIDQNNLWEKISGNLYNNTGNRFVRVTERVGLVSHMFGLGVVASDLDNDGWVDLYITSDYELPDKMFKNTNARFKDVIKERTNHISYYGMGVDIGDMNNDRTLEIGVLDMTPPDQLRSKTLMASMNPGKFYGLVDHHGFAYQYMFNTLQWNHGNGHFSDVGQISNIAKTDWSWTLLMADLDNNGFKDIYITNGFLNDVMDNDFMTPFKARKVEVNNKFTDSEKLQWVKKLKSTRLPNYAYSNSGNVKLKDVSAEWGLNEMSFSNGAVYADLDNDGDLDVIVNNLGGDKAYVYENHTAGQENGNFLQIKLNGPAKNKLGLNTKITLYAGGQAQYIDHTLTRGYHSSVDPIVHFGLGRVETVDSIVVDWLDRKRNVLRNVKSNQRIEISASSAKAAKKDHSNRTQLFNRAGRKDLAFRHTENEYNDFLKEILLPHKNSQHGPGMAVGDVNGDGKDDFYIGGAKEQAGAVFISNQNGEYSQTSISVFNTDAKYEDMDAAFFDCEGDGDLDLYVVSGGNEYLENDPNLADRIYINDGKGNWSRDLMALPLFYSSGSTVCAGDFTGDGLDDIFVGGRMIPARYPFADKSYLLENKKGKLEDVTDKWAPSLRNVGMVTSAVWSDQNKDGKSDLVLAGEWMSVLIYHNDGTSLTDVTPANVKENTGWWSALSASDIDDDGDMDLIGGNLGLNYKYKASSEKPFKVYAHDFDDSGTLDVVLSYYANGDYLPVRGRECSSEQMPFIAQKFPTYKDFATATLEDVYGEALAEAYGLQATNFASMVFLNNNGSYDLVELPQETQFSCINDIIVRDFDGDGNQDLLTVGNLFVSEVETPRNDASVGAFLKGDGTGKFSYIPSSESGFFNKKDAKALALLRGGSNDLIIVANNDDDLAVFECAKR